VGYTSVSREVPEERKPVWRGGGGDVLVGVLQHHECEV